MLQETNNKKDQKWKYLMIIPIILGIFALFSFDEYYVPIDNSIAISSDTIPENMITYKEVIDTIVSFDSETYTETFQVVKSQKKFVNVVDTVTVFDFDTKQETIQLVKASVPIEEYEKNYGKALQKEIQKKKPKQRRSGEKQIDTITIFDYDTYEETVSIVERIDDCYTFFWGNSAFTTSHEISVSQLKSLIVKKVSVSQMGDNCAGVDWFTFNMVVVPEKLDPKKQALNKSSSKLNKDMIPLEYQKAGTKIFIEDIKVNGLTELKNIVLNVI